jgi:hypothetical protein
VDVRYAICVIELNRGSGEAVSRAALASGTAQLKVELENKHTSSVVELGGNANTRHVLLQKDNGMLGRTTGD